MFTDTLLNIGINPHDYLNYVKNKAYNYHINPNNLYFSDKEKYKLYYNNNGKKIYFGANNYGDYYIWSFLENNGDIEKDTAIKKRYSYVSRAENIKGNWQDNRLSKNNLAINILWAF